MADKTERLIDVDIQTGDPDLEFSSENRDTKQYMIPVNKYNKIIQGQLNLIDSVPDEDDEAARADLNSYMDRFLSQSAQDGDCDDFHNFAVSLAKKDQYLFACQILELGLKFFPKNVDLISDYLKYGTKCGLRDECKKQYRNLLKIPRFKWTWRGFSFLIDYILYLIELSDSEKEIEAKKQEILGIVADFRKYYPDDEETYNSEADLYKHLNDRQAEISVLQAALDNLAVAPKCALRMADILFDSGKYREASVAIKRCISDSVQTQSSVNEGYMYYLSALCTLAVSYKDEQKLTEKDIISIYCDFNTALKELRNSTYSGVIATKVRRLHNEYKDIEIPDEYDLVIDCLDE